MSKSEESSSATGFVKNGQIKVSQNPNKGFKKKALNEVEYGVDDLIEESKEEEDAGTES